jgi:methylated-DNA-[protein]-cysteine S-methyltransferase
MSTRGAHHHLFETAMGECGIAWNSHGLCGVQLPEKDRGRTELRLAVKCRSIGVADVADVPLWIQSLIADIQRYLAGQPMDFSTVVVDLDGVGDFRQKLYRALREISFGRTITYGELAKRLGSTGWEAARDVGEAMGKNPMPIVIPCHRVLAAGNKPGGFSAYGGIATKSKLLALEGVDLNKPEKPAKPKAKENTPRLPGL